MMPRIQCGGTAATTTGAHPSARANRSARRLPRRLCVAALLLALSLLGVSALATPVSADILETAVAGEVSVAVQQALTDVLAPTPTVSGETVQWTPVATESSYKVAVSDGPRTDGERHTEYLEVPRTASAVQTYTPTLEPGQTAYIGVSADHGVTWSTNEAVVRLAPPTSSGLPVPIAVGDVVRWRVVGDESSYKVAVSDGPRTDGERTTEYLEVPRTASATQTYTPTLEPGETAYIGVSADDGITWSTDEATVHATPAIEPPAPEEPPAPPPPAPTLSVHGQAISWTAIPGVASYKLATILNPQSTRDTTYKTVTGTSATPPAVPGQTVNYGISAGSPVQGSWSNEVTIVYPPAEEGKAPAPPVEEAEKPAPPKEAEKPAPPAEETKEPTPPAEEVKKPAPPKEEVKKPAPPKEETKKPAPPAEEVKPTPPASPGKIIGTNDAAGWGEAAAQEILAAGITWNRVEIGGTGNTLAQSQSDGFKALAIVDNTNDTTPLAQVSPSAWGASVVAQLLANPSIAIAEAANEAYLKGGIAEPVQYGRMYLAAVEAMRAAGIHVKLLFDMIGDYPLGSWSAPTAWSRDASGGGWLRDAVNGVPGLAAAILANGVGTHPYGLVGEDNSDDYGVGAVAAQETLAQTLLGGIPPFYVTEFGYDLSGCGKGNGACSEQDQATKMQSAYEVFIADPHVAGIWWYQSHDDSTGRFGFMNNDNTTRPSFNVLSSFAKAEGQ